MNERQNPIILEEETDPQVIAQAKLRHERFKRNLAWLDAHASEVYQHRGKIICIAGQELFVGDSVEEVVSRAKSVHPDDDGRFTRIIPKERGARIYAC